MFNKILIANRGEIALRIIRACKELGIKTVAVHSDVDVNSLHVRFADEAICIGPAESQKSYLNVPAIMSAAELTDSEAIHPGYGFLAENPHFAEICESCKINFIGPSPKNMRLMGDKSKARQTVIKAKVPIIPGSDKIIESEEEALEVASAIGFPVIIKAAAGGGGKGIRIVYDDNSLTNSFKMAQSEAAAAFGNSQMYIEKYLEESKHVEVQILADKYGNVIHLGERDCSIQRKHQKLIEESPALGISKRLRDKMGEMAIKVAKSVEYSNAGTIEFLLDKNHTPYFMEMNTRIQVEHPITEMVTGIDLIKEQIRIAANEKLKHTQKDVKIIGHSIECRINAEDPKKFIPSSGEIKGFNLPNGPGVRVDTTLYSGYNVLPYYDSLIAKLIVHAEDRNEAISRTKRALDEFIIEGIKTTIPFHQKVLNHPDFIKGEIYTNFLQKFEG